MTTSLQLTGPRDEYFVQRAKDLLKGCDYVIKQAGKTTELQKHALLQEQAIHLDITARQYFKDLGKYFDVRSAEEILANINIARVGLLNNKLGFTSEFSVTMAFSSIAKSLLGIKDPITRNLDELTFHLPVKLTDADKAEVYMALAELVSAPSGTDPVAHGKAMLASKTVSNAVKAQALVNAGVKLDNVTQKEKENKTAKKTDEAGFTALKHMSSSSFSSSSFSSDSSSTLSSFSFMIYKTDSPSGGEISQSQSDGWKRLSSLLPNPLSRDQTPIVSSDGSL